MVYSKQVTEHFRKLYDAGALYVWSFNCQIIDRQSIDKAIASHKGDKHYNEAYYEAKLKEGEGKPGADCSGSFFPVSGFDTTAQGYYNRCILKGKIADIPYSRPCMVFIKGTRKIDHIGWYDGAGRVYEAKNSKENFRHDSISTRRWTYYGIPDFVDYSDQVPEDKTVNIELDVLRKGSKGDQVKTLQRLLKALGFSVGLSGIDGDYGKKTEQAVVKFQSKHKLTADGIVGAKTWEALLK